MGKLGQIRYPDDYPSEKELLCAVNDYNDLDNFMFTSGDFHRYIIDKVVRELKCDEVTIDGIPRRLEGTFIHKQAAIIFCLCKEAIDARTTKA